MIFLDTETNNTLHPFMSEFETTWPGQSIVEATVFMLCFVLSVTQNSMVLVAIYRTFTLRMVPFMFIANLAVTDILLSTTCPILAVTRITRHWIFGDIVCKFVSYFCYVLAICNCFTLILISIDRYYCVRINSNWITRKMIAVLLSIVWLLSFSLPVPTIYFRGTKTIHLQNETFTICTKQWSGMSESFVRAYPSFMMFLFLFGPSSTMVVMYFKLYRFINAAKSRVTQQRSQSKEGTRRQLRLVKMFTIIVLLYLMKMLPWIISSVLRIYFSISSTGHALAIMISMSFSCINPIIYGYFNKLLRKEFRRTLCCK